MMKPALVSLICLSVAACASFPEVEEATRKDATPTAYPELIPLEHVPLPPEARLDETSEAQLEGRINGLKRRAKLLQEQELE